MRCEICDQIVGLHKAIKLEDKNIFICLRCASKVEKELKIIEEEGKENDF